MDPDIMASDDPRALRIQERNAFYESLSLEAKARFLEVLAASQERGMSEEESWREAVIAAETAYLPASGESALDEMDLEPELLADRDPSLPPAGP